MDSSRYLLFPLLTIVIAAAGCRQPEEPEPFPYNRNDIEVERAYDVDMLYSDSAVIRVRIQGPLLLNYVTTNDQRQEFTDGVKVDFFGPDGGVQSTLTAKYAVRYANKGAVIVRDSVIWKNTEQDQMETSEMTWDERNKKIFSNKFVVITRPRDTIYSQGFEANQDFSDIRLRATDGSFRAINLNPGSKEQ